MNRGTASADIFETDIHRETFLGLLADIRQRFAVQTHAYCLMNNHYHLLLHTPRGNLPRAMRHLNGVFTQYMNRQLKRDGPLLRGRYKSVLVEDDTYLLQVSRYIHDNPVMPGLADDAHEYRWSSCAAYLGEQKPPPWLHCQYLLSMLGGSTKEQRQRYTTFMRSDVDSASSKFYCGTRLKPVLGSDAFVKRVKKNTVRDPEIPASNFLDMAPTIQTIIGITCEFFGLGVDAFKSDSSQRPANFYRNVAMYVCQQHGHRLADIANAFDLKHYSAVSSALRRMDMTDISVKDGIENIERHLNDV